MRANLSIYGLYNYDNTIFDRMVLPNQIEKDVLVENLLLECAELEVIYSNPDLLKIAIGSWSIKELSVWSRMANAMELEYNPIENYDRIEDITETETRNLNVSNTETRDLNGGTEYRGYDDNELKVAAYDSDTLNPREQNRETYNSDDSYTDSGTITNSTDDTGSITRVHSNKTHGNIGVTTSQQMLMSEIEVAKINVIDYIINSFKNRFCILVY